MGNEDIQAIRDSYRPVTIRYLMIGDSPPPSGHFFYDADEERIFTSITRKAYSTAFGKEYENASEFLDAFKAGGFFLDELYDRASEQVPHDKRIIEEHDAIENLANRLKTYRPERLLIVSLEIEDPVREAIAMANLDLIVERSYYLGKLYQYEYRAGMVGWFSDIKNRMASEAVKT